MARVVAPVELRPYEDRDEPAVIAAPRRRARRRAGRLAAGGVLPVEAHREPVRSFVHARGRGRGPDRRPPCVHAVALRGGDDDAPSGACGRHGHASRAFQGRGIFSMLTRRALEDLRHEADLVFNTPNEKSLPGYLKMGWQVVGQVPIRVRIRRPIRFLRHAAHVEARSRPAMPPRIDADTGRPSTGRTRACRSCSTTPKRSTGSRPLGAASICDGGTATLRSSTTGPPLREEAGAIRSLAIFRVRPRGALVEATVSELIARRRRRRRAARRALSERRRPPPRIT